MSSDDHSLKLRSYFYEMEMMKSYQLQILEDLNKSRSTDPHA